MTAREGRADAGWYRWQNGDLLLSLHVQPRARKDELIGPAGDRFRVRIAAPPVEGKANDRLRRYLAELFGVPQSQVELVAGGQTRLKRLRIRAPTRFPPTIGPEAENPQTSRCITPAACRPS